jgi:hypothetical protein
VQDGVPVIDLPILGRAAPAARPEITDFNEFVLEALALVPNPEAALRLLGEHSCCDPARLVYVGGMDWQQIAALALVTLTAILFTWQGIRSRQSGSCDKKQCGFGLARGEGASGSVVFCARKGKGGRVMILGQR